MKKLIQDIKARMMELKPEWAKNFWSRGNMRFFCQTMRDFTVYTTDKDGLDLPAGVYRIVAISRGLGRVWEGEYTFNWDNGEFTRIGDLKEIGKIS